MIKNFWRAETGIFLGTWLILMIAGPTRLFRDPGTFLHLGVGQYILSSGHLIYNDPFSFTSGGKPWIAYGWLFDCMVAIINKVGGLDSILLATSTVLACFYTWLFHRLITGGIHWLVSLLILGLAMSASAYHFQPRPHLVTIIFLGFTFARLCDFEARRISLKQLFLLIPVFALWTNIHGGMLGGVGTLAIAVMGWSFAKLFRRDTPLAQYQQIFPLICLLIACTLMVFVNPYGIALPRLWFYLTGSPVVPRFIAEHAPLYSDFGDPVNLLVLFFGVFYLCALAGTLPKRPRITWLIPLVWFCLAWMRIRNGPLFAVTGVIALRDMFPHIRWVTWLTQHGSKLLLLRDSQMLPWRNLPPWRPALIPALLVLTTVVLQIASIPVPIIGHGWVKPDRTPFPFRLLPTLKQWEQTKHDGAPIFNEMSFGGFLISYTPGLRVFIDDRCELYGDEGLLAYAHAIEDDPSKIDQWAQQYGFEIALTIPGSGFDHYLKSSKIWILVERTSAATFYRKITR
jgi:hypothetical protein